MPRSSTPTVSTSGASEPAGADRWRYLQWALTVAGVALVAFTLDSVSHWLFGPIRAWSTCFPCTWQRKLFILSPLLLGTGLLALAGVLVRLRRTDRL